MWIDAQKGLWIYWSHFIEEYLHLWQLPNTILVKLKKQKRSKNDTSCHRCHKSSSPGCRRCFLFSGWLCPCLRSDLPILGWSMQWSNPNAKTKLAFKDKDIYRKRKDKDNKLKLDKGKDNLQKVSLMVDRGEQWKLHSASVVVVLVPGE